MALFERKTQSLRQQLLETHPEWRNNIDRWRFLIDSYYGGKDYRDGKYLTPYMMESREDYESRLDTTPYDNHVKAVVAIYNSFLFRKPPHRYYGSISTDPALDPFIKDADLDGRSFDAIMRDVSTYATVYGNCWIILDKPNTTAFTRAEELQQGIRPYISIFTPENVLDWQYTRTANGYYNLTYLKVYEGQSDNVDLFRVYTPDSISLFEQGADDPYLLSEIPNQLGKIPAVCVYGQRSAVRGIGVSDVGDVADTCRAIYNELSEIEQLGRLTNHPSLVKTASTEAAAGAGSIIQMPEDLQGELKPYLLQPDASSMEGFLQSLKHKIEAIDRMSHMGGIRSIESRRLSGVALATEFQLLNARLSEKARNLEHAEEQIWRLWAQWQGTVWDGSIEYPTSFNIQDKFNDMTMLKTAKDAKPTSQTLNTIIEREMLKLITDEEEYEHLESRIESFDEPIEQDPRLYADGEAISDDLPRAYQPASNDDVPSGQMCKNCAAYQDGMCTVWNNAPVRKEYWCKKWIPINNE